MEKAKRIVFTVAFGLSLGMIFLWIILGACMITLAENIEFIQKYAESSSDPMTTEFAKAYFMTLGIIFFVLAVMNVVSAIVAFKGRNSMSKGVMIGNIVIGALACAEINIVAAIFGLIAISRKNRQQNIIEE